MTPLRDILLKLCRREDLSRDEARTAFLHIMSGNAADAEIGGLLVGLAAKGTTVDELVGAASVMREKVIPVDCAGIEVLLDTCGTGGDIRHTFNISTAAALIAAGAGIKVVKHGNRSASSNSGAADVLEKLGLNLQTSPADLRRCLDRANICFAFSRAHHPAMKHVASTRTALGIPTIFNLLGPLTNPGQARHQLLGVFAPELTDRLAAVLREMGSTRAWVVHAEDGLDEISTLGPTRISELRDGHIKNWTLDPKDLGIPYARLSDLQVQSPAEAAEALKSVLRGEAGPRRDIAILNAAAAIVIAGAAKDLPSAFQIARTSLDERKAERALALLISESNPT
jgi:anthranilate phosphoribosyltransferase